MLDGLRRGGWRLVFTATPTESFRQTQGQGVTDLSYSIGLVVDEHGIVRAVAWDGLAFRAGITVGTRLVRIDYHGTLRYPRLERLPGTRDGLTQRLAPLPR